METTIDGIIVLVFAVSGAVLLSVAIVFVVRTTRLLATGTRVVATVRAPSGFMKSPRQEFTFRDETGGIHSVRSKVSSYSYRLDNTKPVELVYWPSRPESAREVTVVSLWLLPIICGGLSLLFSGFAVILFLVF